jgi:hypothetical protein
VIAAVPVGQELGVLDGVGVAVDVAVVVAVGDLTAVDERVDVAVIVGELVGVDFQFGELSPVGTGVVVWFTVTVAVGVDPLALWIGVRVTVGRVEPVAALPPTVVVALVGVGVDVATGPWGKPTFPLDPDELGRPR